MRLLTLALGPIVALCAPLWSIAGPTQEASLVIRHATLLTMTGDSAVALENHSVVIRGDTIHWVGPDPDLDTPPGARTIDASGLFLMPGLIDMHVHVSEPSLPLFLANGVTTVRELNGSPRHLEMRSRIASGALVGPRLFVSSPLLTGQSWPVRHVIVPDADSATSLIATLADAGYDLVKIYDGLSAPTYRAIVAGARSRNLPVTGHIPESVGLAGVLDADQDLEHVEKIVWATVGHSPDAARIPEIVEQIRAAGVRLTPTLWSQKVLMSQGTVEFEALFDRREMRFIGPDILGWWGTLRRPGTTRTYDTTSTGARIHAFQRQLVLELYRAGVPLVLGTDTPNPLLVPGFSVHDEIGELVDAGIPAYAVLRSGTAVAAEALGSSGRLGVIAKGAAADLVLLEADPLTTPGTLRSPIAIVAGGRWFDRSQLAALLAAAMPADTTSGVQTSAPPRRRAP